MTNILIHLLAFLLLSGCYSSANSTSEEQANLTQEAQLAFDNMADTTALELSEKACNLESADGCFLEGEIYRLGRGVQKDSSKAISLYEMSAKKGSIAAQYKLGKMYYLGKGVSQNSKKAISYLEKAALKGDLNSIKLLVFIFETSDELLKDNQKTSDNWRAKLPKEVEDQSMPIYASSNEWAIGAKIQTIGGIFKIFYNDKKVSLDNHVIDKLGSEHEFIDKTYAFNDKNIIVMRRSSGDNTGNYEKYYMYTIFKDETVKKTPILGMGYLYKQFSDDDTIILKIRNEQGINKTVLYEEGIIKVDGSLVVESGSNLLDFIMSNEWNQKFRQLLGNKYDDFIMNISLASPTFLEGDTTIIGDGCRPHMCGSSKAGFAIIQDPSKKDIKIYAIMNEDGKVTKFGFNKWNEETSALKGWSVK